MPDAVERQASIDQEAQFTVAELLRGVPLSDAERNRARAIIRAEVEARRAVPRPPPASPWAAWDRGLELMAERDAALTALLATDAQRTALAANLAAQRQMLVELRRKAEEQQGSGRDAG